MTRISFGLFVFWLPLLTACEGAQPPEPPGFDEEVETFDDVVIDDSETLSVDTSVDTIDLCPMDEGKTEPGLCGCGIPEDDEDKDGVPDCNDECPLDSNKIASGVCDCGVSDEDGDADGAIDCAEECPDDPLKTAPGFCGCGVPDADLDEDGTIDCEDLCPDDIHKVTPGKCGCGVPDKDSDGDGVVDCKDGCVSDPRKISPGICGCGVLEGTCGGVCVDKNKKCASWAAKGECAQNPDRMFLDCCKSCEAVGAE